MTAPHPPTFPALTYAKLAPTTFLTAHLTHPTHPYRPSNRTPTQTRPPTSHTGSLSHAHGSAVVRCGDTAAVCGVRGEILPRGHMADEHDSRTAQDEMALDLLVPNLELATGCAPGQLPGGPPTAQAQVLTRRVATLLRGGGVVGVEGLRIREEMEGEEGAVKAFWVLYIDVLFISLDGNAFDAAWLAVLAALGDTVLPRAWWDGERGMVLCSDDAGRAKRLVMGDVPVPLSFGVFEGERGGRWVLVDMDGFEEGLCAEEGTVVVGGGERVVRIEKSGGAGVGVAEMRTLVELARKRREEWMELLKMG